MDEHYKLDPKLYPDSTYVKEYALYSYRRENNCVIHKDKMIIGFAFYKIEYGIMTITAFVIDKKCRRCGYGKKLFNKLEGIARKNKCKSITLQVSVKNNPALEFYKNKNFEQKSLILVKRIKK